MRGKQNYFIVWPCENKVRFHARSNSEANIGQQPSGQTPPWHGNIWVDSARYVSGYGAVNLNDTTLFSLASSLFSTYSGIPSHNPNIPLNDTLGPFYVNDQQWFFPSLNPNTFYCDSSSICSEYIPGEGGEDYRIMVANDEAESSLFIPESKIIAQQYLFKELKEDSLLLNSEMAYMDFVQEKESGSVGVLFEVEKELSTCEPGDSLLSAGLRASNLLLKAYGDSIRYVDSLLRINTTPALQLLKENLIAQVITSRSDITTTGVPLQAGRIAHINAARSMNEGVQAEQTPDANEKFINDVNFRYITQGITTLQYEYESLLQIAVQCPYSGGPAVYRARTLLNLLNDTLEYQDKDVCEIMGIYRLQNTNHENTLKQLKIFPNPSGGNIQMIYYGLTGSEIRAEVTDAIGRIVLVKTIGNLSNTCQFILSALKEGIYSLKLIDEQGNYLTERLIITK